MTRNKYNAHKTTLYGITFDSKAEAERYLVLRSREEQGEIRALTVHPKFILMEGFTDNTGKRHRPTYYIGDFRYYENGTEIVEDVKGGKATQTAVFRLKAKMFRKRYPGIAFRVVEV